MLAFDGRMDVWGVVLVALGGFGLIFVMCLIAVGIADAVKYLIIVPRQRQARMMELLENIDHNIYVMVSDDEDDGKDEPKPEAGK